MPRATNRKFLPRCGCGNSITTFVKHAARKKDFPGVLNNVTRLSQRAVYCWRYERLPEILCTGGGYDVRRRVDIPRDPSAVGLFRYISFPQDARRIISVCPPQWYRRLHESAFGSGYEWMRFRACGSISSIANATDFLSCAHAVAWFLSRSYWRYRLFSLTCVYVCARYSNGVHDVRGVHSPSIFTQPLSGRTLMVWPCVSRKFRNYVRSPHRTDYNMIHMHIHREKERETQWYRNSRSNNHGNRD